MLVDRWDISHICIAVDDLDTAMTAYSRAFGMEWATVMDFTGTGFVGASDVHEGGVSHEGLRAVLSRNGGPVTAGVPFASLELAEAAPGSPAFSMWGCADGRHYVHHMAYWVDDFDAESQHLADSGFVREMHIDLGDGIQVAYHGRRGFRIELQSSEFKPAAARFLATGEISLG
jgi:catechol 2,3-dioxygenase-like lactoylglutathione lyase family enzyme